MTAMVDVMSAFRALIGRWLVPNADAMNHELRALILAEERQYSSLGRSNIGGWHSRTDFLNRPEPAVAELTTWITWAVNRMADATTDPGSFKGVVALSGWATICRAGAYHAPHSHPDSAWSGVYYVDAGTNDNDRSLSGVLEFLDPRTEAEAVAAPGDSYTEPVRVRPQAGLIVIFPSWLYHWVHPYAGHSPRIAVSFNVTGRALAAARAIADVIAGQASPARPESLITQRS
jgi:uncharacterized protein (TIGR02466 family)